MPAEIFTPELERRFYLIAGVIVSIALIIQAILNRDWAPAAMVILIAGAFTTLTRMSKQEQTEPEKS